MMNLCMILYVCLVNTGGYSVLPNDNEKEKERKKERKDDASSSI